MCKQWLCFFINIHNIDWDLEFTTLLEEDEVWSQVGKA
jgi:hypothetical protein